MDEHVRRELDQIDRRLVIVESATVRAASVEAQVAGVVKDVEVMQHDLAHLGERVGDLRVEVVERFDDLRRDIDARFKKEEADRASSRRWTVGAIIASAGVLTPVITLGIDHLLR